MTIQNNWSRVWDALESLYDQSNPTLQPGLGRLKLRLIEAEWSSWNAWIESVRYQIVQWSMRKRIQIEFRADELGFFVPKEIQELLSDSIIHLVRNTIAHATGEGLADRAATLIHLRVFLGSFGLQIQYEDNGPGVPTQDLEKIFDPGFSTQTQPDTLSGKGMGLDSVRSRLLGAGAQIRAYAPTGRGLGFMIQIPLREFAIEGIEASIGPAHLIFPAHLVKEEATPHPEETPEDFESPYKKLGLPEPMHPIHLRWNEPHRGINGTFPVTQVSEKSWWIFRVLDPSFLQWGNPLLKSWMQAVDQSAFATRSENKPAELIPLVDATTFQTWLK